MLADKIKSLVWRTLLLIDAWGIYLILKVQDRLCKREMFILVTVTSSTKLRAFVENIKRILK